MKRAHILILMLFSTPIGAAQAPWVGQALNGLPCLGGAQGFGPYDYTMRSQIPKDLTIVETYHFTPEVEQLIAGHSGTIEGDIDYTLRAWPNHHKALLSIVRYQLGINSKMRQGKLKTPPECYLQRAIHFSPQDSASYSIYAYYLNKVGQSKRAADVYEKAIKITPNNAKLEYAYSLLLIELKKYDEALDFAKKAYAHGKPPLALQNKLKKLGVWK